MFKPVMPPPIEGPQVPAQNPVPPMPTHPPTPVVIRKVPAPVSEVEAEVPWLKRHAAQAQRGAGSLWETGRNLAWAGDLDDEALKAAVLKDRRRVAAEARRQRADEVRKLRDRAVVAAQAGNANQAERLQRSADVVASSELHTDADGEVAGRDLSRKRAAIRFSRCAMVAAGVGGGGIYVLLPNPLLLVGALVVGVLAAWSAGREKDDDGDEESSPVSMVKAEAPAAAVDAVPSPYGGAGAETPTFNAPPPPAMSQETVTEALRAIGLIKPDATVAMLSAPAWGKDGTATTVFDLPSGITVTMLKAKIEAFAGALGRDVSMVDIDKAGTANRASVWLTDADPFLAPRPSPLLMHKGGIDAWRDGIPVAWAKRGNTISLPVRDSHFVIAGMTRSGKGVGAANLAAGASLDVRINLRVVAGKTNGEFDPYARTGVAATYFKQTPARLLALVKALLADMNRRNSLLGELGKSKLTPQSIERIGGIELLVIDELATFTRPGSNPDRDELLAKLEELASVATGAGIFVVLITQYPEVDIIPQGLAMNCGTRWAMRVDNATQSNAILGSGSAGSGRDASKFDPPLPGLGWLVNPFAGVTDKARSFDLDEDEREEVTALLRRAADLRNAAGRLVGQWEDPIEKHLVNATGLSSAGGGPAGNGVPGKARSLTAQEQAERDTLAAALRVMDELGRDAQLDEMAARIGVGMTAERLGELLRAAGAGGTVKITVPHKAGRVNGYQRADVKGALKLLQGT